MFKDMNIYKVLDLAVHIFLIVAVVLLCLRFKREFRYKEVGSIWSSGCNQITISIDASKTYDLNYFERRKLIKYCELKDEVVYVNLGEEDYRLMNIYIDFHNKYGSLYTSTLNNNACINMEPQQNYSYNGYILSDDLYSYIIDLSTKCK